MHTYTGGYLIILKPHSYRNFLRNNAVSSTKQNMYCTNLKKRRKK